MRQVSAQTSQTRMLSVALAVVVLITAACNSASAPPFAAAITAPNANTQFMVGQPVDIQGKVTGSALKTVDIYIDNARFTSVTAGVGTTEFTVSASWVPLKEGLHAIQFKGLNDKGEVVVNSDAVIVSVNGPTPIATALSPQVPVAPPTAAGQVTAAVASTVAPPTTAPVLQGAQASVKEGDYVNVRKGPGYTYDKLGTLNAGQTAAVTGKSADAGWWQIRFPAAADGLGWVVVQLINVSGDVNAVQVASAPPAPTVEPVAVVPTSPPAPTQAPVAVATQAPSYAQQPYSQKMRFAPRDNIGDIPLGINAEPRVIVLSWEVYGATKLEMDVQTMRGPSLYNDQCVAGNLDNIQASSNYVAHQRFGIDVPKGYIQFTMPSTGYYVFTIYVTKSDGSTTTIPRAVLVENCYKRQ